MAYCEDCLHFKVCEAFGKTVKFPVDDGVCLHFAKETNILTNADRIRAMSDKELKEFLCSILQCKFCKFEGWGGCGLLEWLKQPAEEV